ncbi:MAG: dTMP kinase [Limisphaerales bacterium]
MTSPTNDCELNRVGLGRLVLPSFAAPDSTGPFIVALEGPNGAGKTTLARALQLPHCLGTDDAWFTEPFKVRMIREAEWFASAMFFLSGCFEQMRVIRKRQDKLIVMDRSLWSTLAVHGAESLERLDVLLAMLCPVAAKIRVPHLTLVLEASFATCQARIANKAGTARRLDELTANAAFHLREQEFYRWLSRQRSEVRFLDVDQAPPEAVALQARNLIRQHAPC